MARLKQSHKLLLLILIITIVMCNVYFETLMDTLFMDNTKENGVEARINYNRKIPSKKREEHLHRIKAKHHIQKQEHSRPKTWSRFADVLPNDTPKTWAKYANMHPNDRHKYSFKHKSWFEDDAPVASVPDFLTSPHTLCPRDKRLDYIVLVNSAIDHTLRRQAIRDTFGQRNVSITISQRVVFLLGRPTSDSQADIDRESTEHGDIVQGDFIDTYHNLTLKGLMGLQFIVQFCPEVDWVVKIDDDVIVNVFKMANTLFPVHRKSRHLIGCSVNAKGAAPIMRMPTLEKWVVEPSQFKNLEFFPFPYCHGWFVVLSGDLVAPLLAAARVAPFFWIDDVYLFGLLPDVIGDVTHLGVDLPDFQNGGLSRAIECFKLYRNKCGHLAAVWNADENLAYINKLWEIIKP